MKLSLVAAVSENGIIGRNNALIWHIPEDLLRFKAITIEHSVIMGRRCFESIGRPLTKRRNIVLTRNTAYKPVEDFTQADLHIVHSPEDAIRIAYELDADQTFVIGGEQIYRLFLPSADRIYMTRVHHRFCGDAYFPELGPEWHVKSVEDHLEAKPFPYSFLLYEKAL